MVVRPRGTSSWYNALRVRQSDAIATDLVYGHVKAYFQICNYPSKHEALAKCWTSVEDAGPTFSQRFVFAELLLLGCPCTLVQVETSSWNTAQMNPPHQSACPVVPQKGTFVTIASHQRHAVITFWACIRAKCMRSSRLLVWSASSG